MAEKPPPPQSIDAEESVLGAMLLPHSRRAVERVLEVLEPGGEQKFYRAAHAAIYAAARSLYLAGQAVDPVALASALEAVGKLEEVGGKARIAGLSHAATAASNAARHAEIVREAWVRREIIRSLGDALTVAWNGAPSEEAMERAEQAVLEVRSRVERGREGAWTAEEAVRDLEERLANPPDDSQGVPGPFRFIPKLMPGRLYVLGGYSGDGKSALGVQFLRSAAEKGRRVGYFTIEMSRSDLRDRLVSSFGIPYRQVMEGRVMAAFQPVLERALATIRRWPFELVDEARSSAAIWRWQRLRPYELVIVDHLHRMEWRERRDLERAVQEITNLALAQEIPVLLLAQFHRPPNRDDFPRPTMGSFRESGVIEQEASLACAIWRHRDKGRRTDKADFLVMKNRYGGEGSWPLQFRGSEVRFVEETQ